tara:strand:+ start:4653 stop:6701 length:2049 start_codon:yes stop_codon:yes gene_type:complete
MVASVASYLEPEYIENVLNSNIIVDSDDEKTDLLGIQTNEHWLVMIIEFEGLPSGPGKDAERAEAVLMGVNGADDYLEQATASQSSLEITIVDSIYSAPSSPSAWGTDSDGRRDISSDGSRPSDLAESAIRSIPNEVDLSKFDLDNDGNMDRLLLLHTGRPQETSGRSSDIWSHFQYLSEPIAKGNTTIAHYTMASFQSGLGTIIHEMIHQMGGLDLYDVHDEIESDDWNGVGDFDIMSSGNWNGNGRTPSLPMAATMDLIGLERTVDADILGNNVHINLTPMSAGGNAIKFSISPTESVYMEYRGNVGFDKDLPGHGLLVSIVDVFEKSLNKNEVNINPDSPYLRIVEADGNSALKLGVDSGAQSDLFVQGDKIGSDGYLVYDAHGRLVNWNVTILNISSNSVHLHLQLIDLNENDVLPIRSVVEILENESIPLVFDVQQECIPWISLTSSDGRNARINTNSMINTTNTTVLLDWIQPSIDGSKGTLNGKIGCGEITLRKVVINWAIVPHKIINSYFETFIPYDELSTLTVPTEIIGNGSRIYSVSIEGALDRITETNGTTIITRGSTITLTVDPNGLLTPNMFAEGTIVLLSEENLRSEINVKLYTDSHTNTIYGEYIDPPTLVSILILLLAFTILPSFKSVSQSHNRSNNEYEYPSFGANISQDLSNADPMEDDDTLDI